MVANKKEFAKGLFLCISFLAILVIIYSPVFGGKNGLEYADTLFNSIAKGSTYYIPDIVEENHHFMGKVIDVSIEMNDAEEAEKTSRLFFKTGESVALRDNVIKITGDLGKILESVLDDSDAMFKNEGSKVSGRYGYDEKEAMYNWWLGLKKLDKALKKQKKFAEAKWVTEVVHKAVETGYNFYGIEPQSARTFAGTLTTALVFYVIYSMWWGFSIFFLFEGLGLKMEKAKEKKEV